MNFYRISVFALLAVACGGQSLASPWSVTFRDSTSLDATSQSVAELSGVTYLGPAPTAGKHRFAAVQDDGGIVVTIDAEFDTSANLVSVASVSSAVLDQALDFEGIVSTGEGSVFVSEEGSPGVREYDPNTGNLLQVLGRPSVFGFRRPNRGFESLARSADGTTMWTANEEALTVDGNLSTPTTGSTVRLLKYHESGSTYTAGSQYAYVTEPLHGSAVSNSRSGLSDLVVLPDGTLLALERSAAGALPPFLTSIFEVDFENATDISDPNYDVGLIANPSYTPASKELLWAGAADGGLFGVNLEGLALGPRLANGNWVLFGVSDEGNTNGSVIATWELSATPDADFNADGGVDGIDFLAWQAGFGTSLGAKFQSGDADRDGDVDGDDLAVWAAGYAAIAGSNTLPVPEPTGSCFLLSSLLLGVVARPSRYLH